MSGHNTLQEMNNAVFEMLDPGDAGTIRVDRWNAVVQMVSAGTESRTLDRPLKVGHKITLVHQTDGGSVAVTVTGGYDVAGNTICITYNAGESITFEAIQVGSVLRWQVKSNDGFVGPRDGALVYSSSGYYIGTSVAKMWEDCPSPADPRYNSLVHEYFNDFRAVAADLDVTNEWTYTETGGGGAAALTADATAGTMTLTTDALDNDACNLVLNQQSFKLATGKKLWFEARVQVTTAAKHIQSDWTVGLINSEDLKAVADNMPANGIVFHKDDGDANIDFSVSDNGTNNDNAAVGTSAAATWVTLGFYFDGGASGSAMFTPYINGVAGDAVGPESYATQPTCCPVFMFRNGEAGAVVFTIDYVKVVQMR